MRDDLGEPARLPLGLGPVVVLEGETDHLRVAAVRPLPNLSLRVLEPVSRCRKRKLEKYDRGMAVLVRCRVNDCDCEALALADRKAKGGM